MKTQQNNERMIFIVVFGVLSIFFNKLTFFEGMNRFLVSGTLGAIGGILGALAYELVAKSNNYVKYGFLAVCICAILGVFYLVDLSYKKEVVDAPSVPFEDKVEELAKQPLDTNRFKTPVLTDDEREKLITCEICGYKAVNPDSVYCYNCFGSIFSLSGYSLTNKNKWLKEQQLIQFYPDEKTHKVNFFEPKIENGFRKDPSWKPSVSEQEVIEYRKKYPY